MRLADTIQAALVGYSSLSEFPVRLAAGVQSVEDSAFALIDYDRAFGPVTGREVAS